MARGKETPKRIEMQFTCRGTYIPAYELTLVNEEETVYKTRAHLHDTNMSYINDTDEPI